MKIILKEKNRNKTPNAFLVAFGVFKYFKKMFLNLA